MRKADLVTKVKETGLTAEQAAKAVSTVFDSVLEALANGDSVIVTGFGAFRPIDKPEKDVRNPMNGVTVRVPAHIKPTFAFAEGVRITFRNGEQIKFIKG